MSPKPAPFLATRLLPAAVIGAATALVATLASSAPAGAPSTPYAAINAAAAADPIRVQPIRGGVSMLSGSGGNIGVLAAPGGALLGDAGIAVSRGKIVGALRGLGVHRIAYLVSTHWHWDHTEGNAWVGGTGARIVGTPATRRRLSSTIRVEEWGHTFTPVAAIAKPVVLVTKPMSLRLGGETVLIRLYGSGHTDTDLSLYYRNADVLQTGDTFWNGVYPFIDYAGGGGIDGAIRQADANLALAGARTLIIPGHGPVGNRRDLLAFRDMLVTVRSRVAALKHSGKSVEQTVAANPTGALDAKWGRSVIRGALFTRLVYRGV